MRIYFDTGLGGFLSTLAICMAIVEIVKIIFCK